MGQNQTPKTQQPKSTLDKIEKGTVVITTTATVVGGIIKLVKAFGKK